MTCYLYWLVPTACATGETHHS